jgi:hypothetical protein
LSANLTSSATGAGREPDQQRDRRGDGVSAPVSHALLPSADRAWRHLKRFGELGLRQP